MNQLNGCNTVEEPIDQQDALGRFAKGNTMSPGRKPIAEGGKPNAITLAREQIETQLESVIKAMIDSALAGDTSAGKIIINLVMPQLKQTDLHVTDINKLPKMIVEANIIDVIPDKDVTDAELVEKPVNKG